MSSRLRRPAGALLATVLAASILGVTPSAYAADGTISGTVTGAGGALGTASVQAYVLQGGTWFFADNGYGTADADGDYTLSLPPGAYRLGFHDEAGGYIDEFHTNAATVEGAQTISVGDAASVEIDADLAVASHITGNVTGPDGLPLEDEGVGVAAYELITDDGHLTWDTAGYTFTDTLGNYDLGGLPAGTYRVGFDYAMAVDVLAEEFYDDQASQHAAEDIVVGALTTVPGIDAQLAAASQITGTVTDASNAPLAGVEVYAYVNDGSSWETHWSTSDTLTDGSGNYTLEGLAKGTYRIQFEGQGALYETWNNKGRIEDGDDIVVTSNETVTGKDAQLVAGEHDDKYLERLTQPAITGTPLVGSTLAATSGTWNPAPTAVAYQWYRGWDAIPGATGSSYTLAAADLGQYISFGTVASLDGYETDYNGTDYVGPIAAAPAPPIVAPPVVAPAPVPVISFSKKIDVAGKLVVGSTLKLKNYKALVTQVAATATYKIQWYAGAKKIKKATKSKLKVSKALKGKKISVKVSATVGSTTKSVKVKVGKIR